MLLSKRDLIQGSLALPAAGSEPMVAKPPPLLPLALAPMLSVLDFGAAGDGDRDDTQAVRIAIATAEQRGLGVVFPRRPRRGLWTGYKVTSGIQIRAEVPVYMGSPIVYHGTSGAAITVGSPGEFFSDTELVLQALNFDPNWDNDTAGIVLTNIHNCNVLIAGARRFRRGVVLQGVNGGNAHNSYFLGDLSENQYCLEFIAKEGGYVNENIFFHGYFQNYSNTEAGKPRFGVFMRKGDNPFNNNVFIKPSFQLADSIGPATAITIEHGTGNTFLAARFENSGNIAAFISGPSEDNAIECHNEGLQLRDVSHSSGNTLRFVRGAQKTAVKATFDTGNLVDTLDPYDDVSWSSSLLKLASVDGWGDLRAHQGLSASGHHLRLRRAQAGWPMLYLELDTGSCKRFVLHRIGQSGHLGRIKLAVLDAAGRRLGAPGAALAHAGLYASLAFDESRGGIYAEQTESGLETVVIKVAEEVAAVWLAIEPGANDLLLNRLVLESAGVGAFGVITRRVPPLALQPPSSRAKGYTRGSVLWNARGASRGAPKGWICTADGAPGTWAALSSL
jgi:hypothetical protein